MKIRVFITLILVIFIAIGICTITNAFPSISAENAALIHLESGELLYGKNEDEKAYPASITKIMTALVAIELAKERGSGDDNRGLDQIVTVTNGAIGVEGSSIYLKVGEKISIRDLLYGLMLRSGNDAAVALAEEFGGTESFVNKMNERAEEIGAVSTNFTNPNGLHDENHYTTAKDMAFIAREAMKNKEFREISKAKSWEANRPDNENKYVVNKNKVVHKYDGGTGIKIGFTKMAGRTLVASSKRHNAEYICIVLNAPNWFNDAYGLMDYAYSEFRTHRIAKGERSLSTVKVINGKEEKVKIGVKKDIICAVKKGEKSNISLVYSIPKKVEAPVSRWKEVGALKVYKNNKFLYDEPMYYLEDIERSD